MVSRLSSTSSATSFGGRLNVGVAALDQGAPIAR
jgi:hypothetical protein